MRPRQDIHYFTGDINVFWFTLWFFQGTIGNRSMESLQWRHNGVSNQQPHHCLFNRLFRRRSKKTPKLRVTGPCAWNSPVTGEFHAQMTSNAENVSIWWRHHDGLLTNVYGKVQQKLKKAKITLLFKQGSMNTMENYHLMSLLPTNFKISERVVFNQIYQYFVKNNLVFDGKCSFGKPDSTELVARDIIAYWVNEIKLN